MIIDTKPWDEFNEKMRELHRKMVSEHLEVLTKAENKLTEEQFVSCVRQAVASGDFFKVITPGGGQRMIYQPFNDKIRLETRVIELEKKLISARKALE
jgi:hypothetical protein